MEQSIIQLHTIQAPQLTDANFGVNMSQQFNNINDNFLKLASAEFLKGTPGDNISIVEYNLEDSSQSENIVAAIKSVLTSGHDNDSDLKNVNGYQWADGITGYIYLIYADKLGNDPRTDWSANLVGSLPYTFLDPRFNNQLILNEDGSNYKDAYDLSCILTWSNGGFQIIDAWPTLYFDEDKFQFCWRIHGKESGLVAQGPQGRDGRSGNMLVVRVEDVEAVDNEEKLDNIYVITHYLPDITNISNPSADWVEFNDEVIQTLGYNPIGCTAMVFKYRNEDEGVTTLNDRYWIATISNRVINNTDKYVVSLSDYNMISTELTKERLYAGLSSLCGSNWGGLFVPIEAETRDEQGQSVQPAHMFIAIDSNDKGSHYNELHILPVKNKLTPEADIKNNKFYLKLIESNNEYLLALTGVSFADGTYTFSWTGNGQTATTHTILPINVQDITWVGHTIDSFSAYASSISDNSAYPLIIHYPTILTSGLSVPSLDGCAISSSDIDQMIQNALASL